MEWWQVVIIPFLGALAGILPFGFYRYNLTRREVARLRRALDCAGEFRLLAFDYVNESSDISKRVVTQFEDTEARYQVLLKEYESLNGFPGTKK